MFTYEEAVTIYKTQFFGGRKKDHPDKKRLTFPYGIKYKDDTFVEVQFPLELIEVRLKQPELVPQYVESVKNEADFPAVWYSIGRKLSNGDISLHWNRKVLVVDGFHRTQAHKISGKKTIKCVMPKSHWEFFNTLEVRSYELYCKN
mgnify:CR=1 FL=1